eukprot:6194575-Pleurochrysis_carterae.AAC.1
MSQPYLRISVSQTSVLRKGGTRQNIVPASVVQENFVMFWHLEAKPRGVLSVAWLAFFDVAFLHLDLLLLVGAKAWRSSDAEPRPRRRRAADTARIGPSDLLWVRVGRCKALPREAIADSAQLLGQRVEPLAAQKLPVGRGCGALV